MLDYYAISISPPPLSYPTEVSTSSVNVTLNNNVEMFSVSIAAVNCNGRSLPLLMDINIGEFKIWMSGPSW